MNDSLRELRVDWLVRRPHLLLAGHLFLIHVLAFGGWQMPAVRLLWLVALGLFLIWQPFVAGERRIGTHHAGLLVLLAMLTCYFLGPWLLLVWCGALAAVIGGRVMWTESRRERAGYLLAFGYLVVLTIFGVVPALSPAIALETPVREAFARFLPLLLPLLLPFPARPLQRRAGDAFDLFYGLLVFLVLAVFVLGALAYMLLGGVSYVQSLFLTSLTLAAALLVVAWAWNPRGGFSGIGSAFSRSLLSVGMPLEQWLVQLSETSEREQDPTRFIECAMQRLCAMPWVTGVGWQTGEAPVEAGQATGYLHRYAAEGLVLDLYFRHSPSPAMRWHGEWLLRLAAEFYLVKRQTVALQRLGYQQAVYETGARVTHDVKNLLQSMQTLCYAAAQPGDPVAVAALLGRQLPQITERLKVTLEKLQSPRHETVEWGAADDWWQALQDRYATSGVVWSGDTESDAPVPKVLFDSVAENLLQNALAKRQRHQASSIVVTLLGPGFEVSDDGQAIPETLAARLMKEPIRSEDGLGIGLFHAAQQARGLGYRLWLRENRDGNVVFSLGR